MVRPAGIAKKQIPHPTFVRLATSFIIINPAKTSTQPRSCHIVVPLLKLNILLPPIPVPLRLIQYTWDKSISGHLVPVNRFVH